jgi:hypothetical protein
VSHAYIYILWKEDKFVAYVNKIMASSKMLFFKALFIVILVHKKLHIHKKDMNMYIVQKNLNVLNFVNIISGFTVLGHVPSHGGVLVAQLKPKKFNTY